MSLDYSHSDLLSSYTGSEVWSLVALPGGLVASGLKSGEIKIWNVNDKCFEIKSWCAHVTYVPNMISMPDGRLVSGSFDKTICVSNVVTGKCEGTIQSSDATNHLILLDNGDVVSSSGGGCTGEPAKIWNINAAAGQELVRELTGECSLLGITALLNLSNNHIASGAHDNTVCIWNAASGDSVIVLSGHTDRVTCLAVLSSDKNIIISGSKDNTLHIWNIASGECLAVLVGHTDAVYCVVVLPDNRVVSGSADNTVRIWDPVTGACERVLTGHDDWVLSLAVLPDGRFVSGSVDKTIRLWRE